MATVSDHVRVHYNNVTERTKPKSSADCSAGAGAAAVARVRDVVEGQLALRDIYTCIVSVRFMSTVAKKLVTVGAPEPGYPVGTLPQILHP
jgi:hypothetical protein